MRGLLVMACLAAVASPLAAGVGESGIVRVEKPVPGEYIVAFKEGVTRLSTDTSNHRPTAPALAQELARALGGEVLMTYEYAFRGFAVKLGESSAKLLLLDPRVARVEENALGGLVATQFNPPWGLDRIDQRNLPLNNQYVYQTTASNVHVFIVDTGILPSHTEFTGRVGAGFTSITDGNGIVDCHGHGTHVAGTALGTTYGVAKAARVYPVRVVDCWGFGTSAQFVAGVDWIISNSHLRPAVANASLHYGVNLSVDDAVNRAINSGVTFVVAAANDSQDACNDSPSRVPAAITVGATDSSDARAWFSNFGTCVDLFAPGVGVLSAWIGNNNATASLDGTSMASPHTAGAAALVLANSPNGPPGKVASALVNAATLGVVSNPGAGSPNRLLFVGQNDQPPVVHGAIQVRCWGFECFFSVSATDDVGIVSYEWNYGDGNWGSGPYPNSYNYYYYSGSYWVSVVVTDTVGQTAWGYGLANVGCQCEPLYRECFCEPF